MNVAGGWPQGVMNAKRQVENDLKGHMILSGHKNESWLDENA